MVKCTRYGWREQLYVWYVISYAWHYCNSSKMFVWFKSRVCPSPRIWKRWFRSWMRMNESLDGWGNVAPDFLSKFCRINIYKVKYKVKCTKHQFGPQGYLLTVIHSISLCELFECKPLMSHVPPNLGWLTLSLSSDNKWPPGLRARARVMPGCLQSPAGASTGRNGRDRPSPAS